ELVPEAGAAAGQQTAGLDDPARAQDPKCADEADEPEELNGPERESDAEDDKNREADQPQVPVEPGDPVRGDDEEDEGLSDEDQAGEEIDDPAGLGPRLGQEGQEHRGNRYERGDENRQ